MQKLFFTDSFGKEFELHVSSEWITLYVIRSRNPSGSWRECESYGFYSSNIDNQEILNQFNEVRLYLKKCLEQIVFL